MGNQDAWCTPFDVWRDLEEQGLAIVPAADVPSPISESPISDDVLRHLTECAYAWEDNACLIGNVTARQLQAFCAELAKLRADVPSADERKVLEAMAAIKQRWLEDMVRTCTGPAEWVETCVRLFKAELARRAAKEGKTDG